MENGQLIDGLPIKNGDFPMAMLNNQRVYIYIYISWYNQYVQRNLPLLAGFFLNCAPRLYP